MKVAIIDDEVINRLVIRRILEDNRPDLKIVVEEGAVNKAIEQIDSLKPDILFLDIRLKNGTGFDIAEGLTWKPKIVFTTAYSEYAIKAFKFDAVDYILKPIVEKELLESVDKFKKQLAAKNAAPAGFYSYTNQEGKASVNYDDICYFESSGADTYLVMQTEKLLLPKSITEVEKELPGNKFYRTHDHYIVNMKKIKSIDVKNNGQINLSDEITIPVSQEKLSDFLELIKHKSVT